MNNPLPKNIGLDGLLGKAFSYWNRTLLYQLTFSLVYFSVFILVYFYAGERYGILPKMVALIQTSQNDIQSLNKQLIELQQLTEYQNFALILTLTSVFLYPLNLGFCQIYRKLDFKEKIETKDLFVGYNGSNFFRYAGYYMFWIFVFRFSMVTVVLPIVWVYITLFTSPLMFFNNLRFLETISINIKALRNNFMPIFVASIVCFLFKYLGLITIIGFLFTFPFWNAMLYVLYQEFFEEKK